MPILFLQLLFQPSPPQSLPHISSSLSLTPFPQHYPILLFHKISLYHLFSLFSLPLSFFVVLLCIHILLIFPSPPILQPYTSKTLHPMFFSLTPTLPHVLPLSVLSVSPLFIPFSVPLIFSSPTFLISCFFLPFPSSPFSSFSLLPPPLVHSFLSPNPPFSPLHPLLSTPFHPRGNLPLYPYLTSSLLSHPFSNLFPLFLHYTYPSIVFAQPSLSPRIPQSPLLLTPISKYLFSFFLYLHFPLSP